MDEVNIEQQYEVSVAQVWKSLTTVDQMKQWYFDIKEFKPEVGFRFEFFGTGPRGVEYNHICEVTKVVTNELLQYTWTYEGVSGSSLVTFTLEVLGENSTLLKLKHTGISNFPKDNKDLVRDNFVNGWTYIITDALKKFHSAADGDS